MLFSWLSWALLLIDSGLRFSLLAIRATLPERPPQKCQAEAGGCVILIAAHNEAEVIGATVAALGPLLTEWEGSVLHVIADRCSDATASQAALVGAHVTLRDNGPGSKAAALAWWMETQRVEWQSRPAILVLDADSRLEPGSLAAFARTLRKGVGAAQAFIKPEAPTRQARLAGWSEVIMQRVDDAARQRLGWSVPLRGTGMLFRPSLFATLAPRLHTLAEDLELDVLVAALGERVVFVPEAVVIDPKPRRSLGAAHQRARWLQGQAQVAYEYAGQILRAIVRGGIGSFVLFTLLFLRPKALFIFVRIVAALLGWWRPAVVGLSLDAIYYLGGAFFVDNRRLYLRDLLATPRYLAMWCLSLTIALIKRGWLRAGR
jgi:cellulose synthase/poly-beta-1,6-N-acetylglucosamine synthase-like glycosyltransferase